MQNAAVDDVSSLVRQHDHTHYTSGRKAAITLNVLGGMISDISDKKITEDPKTLPY